MTVKRKPSLDAGTQGEPKPEPPAPDSGPEPPSFFAELKRRKVFRVAAAYAATAFVVLQAADLLASGLALPRWVFGSITVLAIVGFPVALLLAWAYELTPEGVRRTDGDPFVADTLRRARAVRLFAGGAVLAVGLGSGGWWLWSAPAASDEALRVVAVLPFENIAADQGEGHFTAGMRAEIMSQLSKVANLRLMSPAAIAALAESPERVGRLVAELGVGSIVEGSVRLVDGRVRIAVQLTDARSGRTLWAEQYDRESADVLAVQTDVALRISEALRARLSPEERERIARPATQNAEAFELFLRGRDVWDFNRDAMIRASELFRQATRLDPEFALAHAYLAHTFHHLAGTGYPLAADSGMAAVQRALAADSSLAFAHFARGQLLSQAGRLTEARLAFQRALELDPNEVPAMADLSVNLARIGRLDESLHWAERALERAPNLALVYHHVGIPLLALGDDAATERFLLGGLDKAPPGVHRVHAHLAWLDAYRGRPGEALGRVRARAAAEPLNHEVQATLVALAELVGAAEADSLAEAFFHADPQRQGSRTRYAAVLLRRGDAQRAQRLLGEAEADIVALIDQGHEGSDLRLGLASIHAVRGEDDAALAWLRQAYDAGYRDHRELAMHPHFARLRQTRQFQELLARMETEVARVRSRAAAASPLL